MTYMPARNLRRLCHHQNPLTRNCLAVLIVAAAAALSSVCNAQGLPVLAKSFSPTTIGSGGTTVLSFLVTNPAGAGAVSNVGFVDTLGAGLRLANPPNVGGTCSNAAAATTAVAGAGSVTVANLSVPAGAATCTVTVSVTNAPGQFNPDCGANPAAFTNAAGNVTVSNVTNGVAPSCVTVLGPPVIPTMNPVVIIALSLLLGVAGVRWRHKPL